MRTPVFNTFLCDTQVLIKAFLLCCATVFVASARRLPESFSDYHVILTTVINMAFLLAHVVPFIVLDALVF